MNTRSGAGNRRARKERGLRMLPDGRWVASWYDGPHYIRRIFETKSEARLALEAVRTHKAEGRYISKEKEVPFSEAVKRFLEWSESNVRKHTQVNDKREAKEWLASPFLAGKNLGQITAGDVERFRLARLRGTNRNNGKALRGFLTLAARLHRAKMRHTLKGAPRVAVSEALAALLKKHPPARIEEALSWWYGRPDPPDFETIRADLAERAHLNPAKIKEKALGKRTPDVSLSRLKRLFSLALQWGLTDRNPAAAVKLFREDVKRTRYISEEEEARLLGECTPDLRRVVRFALLTGMRRGEILGLRWKDVDFRNAVAVIPGTRAKGKRDRVIHLNGEAIASLQELRKAAERKALSPVPELRRTSKRKALALVPDLPQPSEREALIFGNSEGGEWDRLRVEWVRAVALSGLEDFRFHDLRHTYASRLVMQGVDLAVLRELLGHRDFEMTLRYAHLAPSRLKEAVSLLSRIPNQHLINIPPAEAGNFHRQAVGDSP